MFFKAWPNLSVRSTWDGSSTYDGLQTDPYDDAIRLIDFYGVEAPTAVRNYPKNWGSLAQALAASPPRPDPYVYPLRANPLRQYALGQDFSCCALFPRRLLNDVETGRISSLDSREFGTGRYASVNADSSVTQSMAGGSATRNIDMNMSNSEWQDGTRIGWNTIMTYAHYGSPQPSSSSPNRNPYFLCKDGVVRQYQTEWDEDLLDYCIANFPNFSNFDIRFFKFSGSPPPEDQVSIAKVAIRQSLFASDLEGYEYEAQLHSHISGVSLTGHLLTGQAQVVPGSSVANNSYTSDLSDYNPSWADWPVAAIDGDSGTPLVGMSTDGKPWAAMVASAVEQNVNMRSSHWWDKVNEAMALYSGAGGQIPPGETSQRKIEYYREWEELEPNAAAISGPIKPKRSEVAGSAPVAADLEAGELAINSSDRELFTKKADGTVVPLIDRQADSYNILIESPIVKAFPGYVLDLSVVSDRTVLKFYAKTDSGTCTVSLMNNGVAMGTALAVNNTIGNQPIVSPAGQISAGDKIELVVTVVNSPVDLSVTVEYEQ